MKYKQWMFCNDCDRAFVAFLSENPPVLDTTGFGQFSNDLEINKSFFADLEMQFGVTRDGSVYAECPYEGCTMGPLSWVTWERFRRDHSWAPEVPEEDIVYPLFPLDGQE
jgi:hypothetical protein